jgi:hypothetical protein
VNILSNVINQFIVKPTDGAFIGSQGFVFDILGEEEAMFESDITDHYVEENYAVQDHIALRPPRFTLTGFVGELCDILPGSFLGLLTAAQSMSGISDYTLSFGAQATRVYNQIAGAVSQYTTIVNQATNAYNIITGNSTTASKQQNAYDKFVQLYMDRALCTVETPWATWPNMAIERISILQRDSNRMISEFSITFKQIRTVAIDKEANLFQLGRVDYYASQTTGPSAPVTGKTEFTNGSPVNTGTIIKDTNMTTISIWSGD